MIFYDRNILNEGLIKKIKKAFKGKPKKRRFLVEGYSKDKAIIILRVTDLDSDKIIMKNFKVSNDEKSNWGDKVIIKISKRLKIKPELIKFHFNEEEK